MGFSPKISLRFIYELCPFIVKQEQITVEYLIMLCCENGKTVPSCGRMVQWRGRADRNVEI